MTTVPFTLHVRLTKACNANCTYCSSFMENPDRYMSLEDYKKSIYFFWNTLVRKSINVTHLTIEYVGGEIMLVPDEVLKSQVEFAREFFSEKGVDLIDGAQTNLIGSKRKIANLKSIFGTRISTSIDSFTDQRRVGDSAEKYRVIMMTRESDLIDESLKKVPAVFTMDRKSLPFTMKEYMQANRANRNLVIRPVFNGGSSIESISPQELAGVMEDTFDKWFIKSRVILEPHFSLLEKRIQTRLGVDPRFERSYCSFQNDCAKKSMSLEPNGDLFICQELADAAHGKIGNSLDGVFDEDAWNVYAGRSENLSQDCLSCPYFQDCQGGCMMHSIQDGNGPYGKPSYCYAWKAIFKKIDDAIDSIDYKVLENWIERLKR